MLDPSQIQKQRKSRINAETNGFTCLLVYFVIKAIVLLILYKYDNLLKHQPILCLPLFCLIVANSYLMLTTGKDPGFQTPVLQENQLILYERNADNFCSICNCRRKNRSKHCYGCGKCVRKYDHHCPWIGACVGQKNHFKFWVMLLTHTLQSTLAFHILFQSMKYFNYSSEDGYYSQEFGVFAIFAFFMMGYIALAGGLLSYHTYLILFNVTTRQMVKRRNCHYLHNIKGNPFSQGLVGNIKIAIFIEQEGRQWLVQAQGQKGVEKERSWLQKIWENEYYSCC